MNTRTVTHTTLFQVTEEADGVLRLGKKRHYSFKIVPDFLGPITQPVFSKNGDRIYMVLTEEDKKIIPNLAFVMHRKVRKAGFRDLQVIIGHDLLEGRHTSVSKPQTAPRSTPLKLPELPTVPMPNVDWAKVAKVAKVSGAVAGALFLGLAQITLVSIGALLGSIALVDPTYCICLDDGQGTVIELLSWDTEV